MEAKKFLVENLFVAMPALGSALLQIRDKINTLDKMDFVDTSVIENWSLIYFMERQSDACNVLRQKLIEFHIDVRELLRKYRTKVY